MVMEGEEELFRAAAEGKDMVFDGIEDEELGRDEDIEERESTLLLLDPPLCSLEL